MCSKRCTIFWPGNWWQCLKSIGFPWLSTHHCEEGVKRERKKRGKERCECSLSLSLFLRTYVTWSKIGPLRHAKNNLQPIPFPSLPPPLFLSFSLPLLFSYTYHTHRKISLTLSYTHTEKDVPLFYVTFVKTCETWRRRFVFYFIFPFKNKTNKIWSFKIR